MQRKDSENTLPQKGTAKASLWGNTIGDFLDRSWTVEESPNPEIF